MKNIIPIVFAVDDNYSPFLAVNIRSIIDNGDKNNFYKFYILIRSISEDNKKILSLFNSENCEVEFVDVNDKLKLIAHKLALRDYYTLTIYYRLFIPSIFHQYDKVLYLDCDMVAKGDIAKLYNIDLGDNIVGACREEVMTMVQAFGRYSEDCLGVDRKDYFNSGLLLINCKKYKKINIGYNKAPINNKDFNEKDLNIIHYKLWYKPWLYSNILYEKYFWESAKKTPYYLKLLAMKNNYSKEQVVKDIMAYKNLVRLALNQANCSQNYLKCVAGC